MKIAGQNFAVVETFDRVVTVPDCFVVPSNKIGSGNGEAKLYVGPRDVLSSFFRCEQKEKDIPCFLVKQDLLNYLNTAKSEYFSPSVTYRNSDASQLQSLWKKRFLQVQALPDIIEFSIKNQVQIAGPRGYINSRSEAYKLIRELSLPLITYISIMEVRDASRKSLYYFKLFVDFDAISYLTNGPLVFHYGTKLPVQNVLDKKTKEPRSQTREGQAKYRDELLKECPYCPITMVNDERLLIASHIKPWAVCTDKEKIDPKNGYMFTPLYDKLFDRGFITFSEDRLMIVSDWLSPLNKKRLNLERELFVQRLPMDEKRKKYLEYHRTSVFQGKL